MRVILVALSLLGLTAAFEPASAEITYPWCAQYGGRGGDGGGRNCGFWTYQQCRAALSGNGGYCVVHSTPVAFHGFAPASSPNFSE